MKIITIIGARPQFIKSTVVSRAIREHNEKVAKQNRIDEILIHTGQHFDENMSNVFFEEMELKKPDYFLGVNCLSHGAMTGKMMEKLEVIILEEKPDWVMVYGDTNTTLAGALAAVKVHVPVAHVEAGLRSFNMRMPEEINRVLTDRVSQMLLAPTEVAVRNLSREGIPSENIHLVGDVMYDVALYFGEKAQRQSQVLHRLGLRPQEYILATMHRAENTDDLDRLQAILRGLGQISEQIPIVVPLHPRTRAVLARNDLLHDLTKELLLVEPLGYLDMLQLEKHACLIATDSGGVQKEAFFHRVPCVTLRNETEWVELVEAGWNFVVPPESSDAVADGVRLALASGEGQDISPYGCGRAAQRIVEILCAS